MTIVSDQPTEVTTPRRGDPCEVNVNTGPARHPCGKPAVVKASGTCDCGHLEVTLMCARHVAKLLNARLDCTPCRVERCHRAPCPTFVFTVDLAPDALCGDH